MQDLTPIVADNEKAVQNTERERWDSEEVHRTMASAIALQDLDLSGLAGSSRETLLSETLKLSLSSSP
jgi:hypothetical protein